MAFLLKIVGGFCLILSLIGLGISLLVVFVISVKTPDAVNGLAAMLFGTVAMIWTWAGVMVVGTILFVGGRSLEYMDGAARGARYERGPRRRARRDR